MLETDHLGKIYIPKSDIRSIQRIDPKKDYVRGVYIGSGVFTTRYQFTTNAFPIKRGENYAVINLYGPEVHFSVADNLSVGLLSTWLGSPAALSVKYTLETGDPNLNFGAGALLATSGYYNRGRGFGGLYYGMMTYGTRRNNVTLSGGYAHFNWDYFTKKFYPVGLHNMNNLPESYSLGWQSSIKGPIVGLASSIAMNDRVSLIFDMFLISTSRKRYYQNSMTLQENDEMFLQILNEPQSNWSTKHVNFVFMPAMRFQKKQDQAFQFSLTGVIGYRENSNGMSLQRRNYSFPIPQCTWYFKF